MTEEFDVSREEFLKMSEEERTAAVDRVIKSDPELDKEFKSLGESFVNNAINRRMSPVVPENATHRYEYVKCGNPDSKCFRGAKIHGPYIYAYWKEKGKLKKKYIGRDFVEGYTRLGVIQSSRGLLDRELNYRKAKKFECIKKLADNGDRLAQEYNLKLKKSSVSIDWAYKVVTNEIKGRRFLRVAGLAEKQGIEKDSN